MSYRIEQINKLIKAEIAPLLQKSLEGSKYGLVTVTRVQTTPDLEKAEVWLSIFGEDVSFVGLMKLLNKKIYQIQGEINRKLRMRRVPKLEFKVDLNPEYANRIDRLLAQISQSKK